MGVEMRIEWNHEECGIRLEAMIHMKSEWEQCTLQLPVDRISSPSTLE